MKNLLLCLLLMLSGTVSIAYAQDAPISDGEQEARACYVNAQTYWNQIISTTPMDAGKLMHSYKLFSFCADVSISTGKKLPNGDKVPWLVEYFADTVGASYAQLQLVAADPKSRCLHIALAKNLVDQALMTEADEVPGDPNFENQFDSLERSLTASAQSCKSV